MKKYNLFGYSGHSYVIADTILMSGGIINGYYGMEKPVNPYSIKYLGNENQTNEKDFDRECLYFPSVGDGTVRRKMVEFIEIQNLKQTVLQHPSAIVSPLAILENSVFIGAGAIVNTKSIIKKGTIINTRAIIEHECLIGEFCHIAPGTVLTGNVSVDDFTFIGANSVIIPGKKIGKNVIVGAGSVVLNDIPDNEVWVGNPARKIRMNDRHEISHEK